MLSELQWASFLSEGMPVYNPRDIHPKRNFRDTSHEEKLSRFTWVRRSSPKRRWRWCRIRPKLSRSSRSFFVAENGKGWMGWWKSIVIRFEHKREGRHKKIEKNSIEREFIYTFLYQIFSLAIFVGKKPKTRMEEKRGPGNDWQAGAPESPSCGARIWRARCPRGRPAPWSASRTSPWCRRRPPPSSSSSTDARGRQVARQTWNSAVCENRQWQTLAGQFLISGFVCHSKV